MQEKIKELELMILGSHGKKLDTLASLVGKGKKIVVDTVGSPKCHISILFSFHYFSHSSLFITPLTIHYTIFMNKYGFTLLFSNSFILGILREFMIKH